MSLRTTTLGLSAGFLAATILAWRVEGGVAGTLGTGLLLGYGLGAALSLAGVAWQAHWLVRRAGRAGTAQIEALSIKFGAALACALAFRFVDPLASLADWQSLLLAYAGAVLVALPLSTWDLSKLLAERRADRNDRVTLATRRSA